MSDIIFGLFIGISLSASAGFRIFVPFLVMSFAVNTGYMTPAEEFQWIGSTPALIAFGVATIVEIIAYFIPWVDNLLDSVAAPVAVVAGIILTASSITGLHPFLSWTLAVIAGGGAAGFVQVNTVFTRSVSSATTGGLGNPLLSLGEVGGATILSLLAIFIPVVAIFITIILVFFGIRRFRRSAGSSTIMDQ